MKKRYYFLTMMLLLIFAAIPVSAASNGKIQNSGSLNLPRSLNGKSYNYDAYRYGSYIYYSYSGKMNNKAVCTNYIYRMKQNGSGKTQIAAVRKGGSGNIEFIYGKYLVYGTYDSGSGNYVTSLNIKTGKTKFIKNFCANFRVDYTGKKTVREPYHYKNYFAARIASGAMMTGKLWIYNSNKQSCKVISKKGWDIAINGKYVYYLEQKGSNKVVLRRCKINGSGKKTLATKKCSNSAYFTSVTSKRCLYYADGKSCKYNIK